MTSVQVRGFYVKCLLVLARICNAGVVTNSVTLKRVVKISLRLLVSSACMMQVPFYDVTLFDGSHTRSCSQSETAASKMTRWDLACRRR